MEIHLIIDTQYAISIEAIQYALLDKSKAEKIATTDSMNGFNPEKGRYKVVSFDVLDAPDLLGTTTELNPEIGTHSMGISAGHDNKTDFMDEKLDLGKEIYNMCNNYNKAIANMPNPFK